MHEHEHDHAGTVRCGPKAARLDEPGSRSPSGRPLSGRIDAWARASILGLQRAVGNAGVTAAARGGALAGARRGRAPAARRWSRRCAPTWRAGWATTSATFGCTRRRGRTTSASAVNAHAYTVGSNIVVPARQYDPSATRAGTTLAHELTHVVQQRSGPVDGTRRRAGQGQRSVGPVRARGRRERRAGDVGARPGRTARRRRPAVRGRVGRRSSVRSAPRRRKRRRRRRTLRPARRRRRPRKKSA